MFDLTGKVALVTGVSRKRGLGCGIALGLAREGADVAITNIYKTPEELDPWDRQEGWRGIESAVAEIEKSGRKGLAITADLTKSGEIHSLVERVLQKFGKIDIVVNNAAITTKDTGKFDVVDYPEKAWNDSIAVNLTAAFLICKSVIPQMIKRGQGGKIIMIASSAGRLGHRYNAAYSSSKFGLIGLTQVLADELGPHKINVNAICPAITMTWGGELGREMWEAMNNGLSEEEAIKKVSEKRFKNGYLWPPLQRPGSVEDIVKMALFLASSQSDYITGQAISVDGGSIMR